MDSYDINPGYDESETSIILDLYASYGSLRILCEISHIFVTHAKSIVKKFCYHTLSLISSAKGR